MTSSIFYTCNPPPFLPPVQPLFLILSFLFIFSPLSCGRGTCFLSEQTSRVHRGVGGVGLLCRRLVLLKQIPRISVTQQPRFGTPLKADLVVTGVQGPGERPRQDYSWMFFTFVLFFLSSHLYYYFFFVKCVPPPARVLSGMECPNTPGEIVDLVASTFGPCVFLPVTL